MNTARKPSLLFWCAVAGVVAGGFASIAAFVFGSAQSASATGDERLRLIVTVVFVGGILLVTVVPVFYVVAWALFLRRPSAENVALARFTLGDAFVATTLLCIAAACFAMLVRGMRTDDDWSVAIAWTVGWEALGAGIFAPFQRKALGVFLFSIVLQFMLAIELAIYLK